MFPARQSGKISCSEKRKVARDGRGFGTSEQSAAREASFAQGSRRSRREYKLLFLRNQIKHATSSLADLRKELEKAEEEQAQLKEQAQLTQIRLQRAEKLMSALDEEGQRWRQTVAEIEQDMEWLTGDVFIATAFVSYLGAFSGPYR